ncbi:MAG: hypothetical protein ACRDWY_11635 [Actinomycetes bacterium]
MNGIELASLHLARKEMERELRSAWPDAPVVAEAPNASPGLHRARHATAAMLHRAAHRLAPA